MDDRPPTHRYHRYDRFDSSHPLRSARGLGFVWSRRGSMTRSSSPSRPVLRPVLGSFGHGAPMLHRRWVRSRISPARDLTRDWSRTVTGTTALFLQVLVEPPLAPPNWVRSARRQWPERWLRSRIL